MIKHYENYSLERIKEYIDGIGLVTERWLAIRGYEGYYMVSTFGRIKSLRDRRIIKSYLFRNGHLYIDLYNFKKRKRYSVHRIVAETFIENPENKPQVNHIKGIKWDNRDFMLEWNTGSENQQHAVDTGLRKIVKGENIYCTKLKNSQVLDIFNSPKSTLELSKEYNVRWSVIYQIKSGKNWASVTGKEYKTKKKA